MAKDAAWCRKNKRANQPLSAYRRTQKQKIKWKASQRHAPKKRNIPYWKYLRSKWWKRKRKQKLKSVKYRCERCNKRASQIHHKHYATLWCEANSDLEALCGACHEGCHDAEIQADRHLRAINNPEGPTP